jgi:hypothetical protein
MARSYIIVLIAIIFSISSCVRDNSPLITEDVTVQPFFKLEIKADADIYLYQDDWLGIVAEGSVESLNNLDYTYSNGRLTIRDIGRLRGDTRLYIHVPDLKLIEHDCNGQIIGQNYFYVNGELEIISSRRGDLDMAIIADRIKVRHRSKGKIFLEGETGTLDLKVVDDGDFNGFELYAEKVEVKISNRGNAEVFAAHFLDARINDIGNIYFRGYPEIRLTGNGEGALIDAN